MKDRIYIDYDIAHFDRRDITTVDMTLCDGRKFEELEPRRLFPISGTDKYITLLDSEGDEAAVIRDINTLPDEEKDIINACLAQYYHIPKITGIVSCEEKFGVIKFNCTSDRGNCVIEVRNIVHQIKLTYGIRVLLRDNDDNRYEIPDIRTLDKKSRAFLDDYL